jgi:hypothetical protein
MADLKLTDRASTSDPTGGYLYIIIPDAGSPTGFVSRKILKTDYDADLAALIQTNANDITTVDNRVTQVYQDFAIREAGIITQTTDYEYAQDQGTQIEAIKMIPNVDSTVKCGLTPGGSEIFDTRNVNVADNYSVYRSDKKEMYNKDISARTVYFTITGSVQFRINYQILT